MDLRVEPPASDPLPRALTIDLPALFDRLGGDHGFVVECAELFETELPGMLGAIHLAVRERRADALCRAAHTLKGAASNFCEDGPTKTAGRLDALGRGGHLDEAALLLPQLVQELDDLLAALSELRAQF